MRKSSLLIALVTGTLIIVFSQCQTATLTKPVQLDTAKLPYPMLSDYAFFKGEISLLEANDRVLPYDLVTPLFTDYAHKKRFVWMPEGQQATVDAVGNLQFPDQTVLIKNFYYPTDFKAPQKDWDIIETRLLIQLEGQWQAYTYIWNDAQTDAKLNIIGDFIPVSWKDMTGQGQEIDYVVPNKNQCKSCHNHKNELQPIGPKVRNLNHNFTYAEGRITNQIEEWITVGYLKPGSYIEQFPAIANWESANAHTLEARSLAYLDVNCGHCHNPNGPANTTGLYLTADQHNPTKLGIFKPPVAAGKGSGGRLFSIVPGQPDSSILVFRMESDDPGVMMPELGRVIPHQEGIALIREWIGSMHGIEKGKK